VELPENVKKALADIAELEGEDVPNVVLFYILYGLYITGKREHTERNQLS
jgi:hypothetical protein